MEAILESFKNGEITKAECQARLDALNKKKGIRLQVTPRGAIGIYGLRRMPIVLYRDEMQKILDFLLGEEEWSWSSETQEWMEANSERFSVK